MTLFADKRVACESCGPKKRGIARNLSPSNLPHPLNRTGEKNTPANRGKCRGVLWVGLQELHWVPVPTGSQAFFRENREVARRREDFRRYSGVFRRFKKPRKAAVFFESGGILVGKGRNRCISLIRESAGASAFPYSMPIIRLGNGTDFVPNYQGAGH